MRARCDGTDGRWPPYTTTTTFGGISAFILRRRVGIVTVQLFGLVWFGILLSFGSLGHAAFYSAAFLGQVWTDTQHTLAVVVVLWFITVYVYMRERCSSIACIMLLLPR